MSNVQGIVGVVGLGYVGLPLAVSLARKVQVIGFDINAKRVEQLQQGVDKTGETLGGDLKNPNISFTADPQQLRQCRCRTWSRS
jgi:UDP-N-acetyl-D-glucosamine/UDP-N-acetyl-D-galactosamine dehydrogenase